VYSGVDQIRQLSQLELAGQAERTVLRCKVAALQETVAGLEAHIAASTNELAATRSGPKKAVNGWSTERAALVRKLHMRFTCVDWTTLSSACPFSVSLHQTMIVVT
jgi:hypothetical protein